MRTLLRLVLAAVLLAPTAPANAQFGPPEEQADSVLDDAARKEAITGTLRLLNDLYVFPDVAREMERAIRAREEQGEYEGLTSAKEFAARLTEHLQAVSKDKHLRVRYWLRAPRSGPFESQRSNGARREMTWNNFGFERVERLPGNVGYLDLREFAPLELGRDTAAGAMAVLANTEALILDLRQNGGGTPHMVQFLCSYFFPEEPVHLNSLYFRPEDRTDEFWTLRELPGKRYLDKPVFVLTSSDTFSAAEECAYDLQAQKRAAIIGETTGGGANPGGSHSLGEHLELFVPMGRAINPITQTNWEGVGVQPDVACKRENALAEAQVLALETVLAAEAQPEHKTQLERVLADARARLAELERKR